LLNTYQKTAFCNMIGISVRLVSLRKEKKISQGELAEKVGIHNNVLGRYERGEATPSVDMAAKLAEALEVSLDYLAGKTDVELDKSILDKIISIQKLPAEDKNCIMYSIDGLIQHAKTRQAYTK
jgi:transcriptional regulator with XRE-family HTH domain